MLLTVRNADRMAVHPYRGEAFTCVTREAIAWKRCLGTKCSVNAGSQGSQGSLDKPYAFVLGRWHSTCTGKGCTLEAALGVSLRPALRPGRRLHAPS